MKRPRAGSDMAQPPRPRLLTEKNVVALSQGLRTMHKKHQMDAHLIGLQAVRGIVENA